MNRSILTLVFVTLGTLVFVTLGTIVGSVSTKAFAAGKNTTMSASGRPLTTYERFLPLAVAGDPAIQNFLGYMFTYGEGVERNYEEAHYWFHLAAEEGDSRAQRNLGLFHSDAIALIPAKFYDASEANLWFSLAAANPENPAISPLAAQSYDRFLASDDEKIELAVDGENLGEFVYHGSCAGCHGFNGHAAYPGTPSFARGNSLEKSDRDLVASILHGKGKMPPWGDTLSAAAARKIVSHIRKLFGPDAVQEPSQAQPVARPDSGQLALGENTYLAFCGGCHGFSGIAWYVHSPSFALGERMDKSDEELKRSIKNGLGVMPSWENMLKPGQIDALVKFIRTLAQTYEGGILGELRRPSVFLRFRPLGETGLNWTGDDFR